MRAIRNMIGDLNSCKITTIGRKFIVIAGMLLCCFYSAAAQEKEGTAKIYDRETGYEVNELNVGGIRFNYALNSRQDTVKVWTTDAGFLTAERYKVGTKFKDIPKKLQARIVKVTGYGYALKLDSGWTLYFCEGESCTDEPISSNAEVKWIRRQH